MIAGDCYFHIPNDNHLVKFNKKCVYTDNDKQASQSTDEIEIGNDVWLGRGVKVLPGVKIGDGAIIGAWSVVAKDVPPYAVVVGNPARIKRYRFNPEQIKRLLKIKWWEWDAQRVIEAREGMLDIDKFLKKYD